MSELTSANTATNSVSKDVICLASWRKSRSGNTLGVATVTQGEPGVQSNSQANTSAAILDMDLRLPFYASVEVNDLHWVKAHFSCRRRNEVVASVKKILAQEFGPKRVSRTGFLFAIKHRDAELLISALLRVQFYTHQIILPEYNLLGERVEQNGMSITWGVGRSWSQAQQDRLRKVKARLPGSLLSKDP